MSTPLKKRSASSPLCSVPYCRNKKAKGRNICHRCRARAWRERNPVTAAFHNLKHRAAERKHAFEITLAEFRSWCAETNYIELKGKTANSLSIDRREEHGPYAIWNIQIMTLAENSRKSIAMRKFAAMSDVDPSKPYTEEDRPW